MPADHTHQHDHAHRHHGDGGDHDHGEGHGHGDAHDHGDGHAHDHSHGGPRNIYVYSPSGAVRDRRAFRRGVARLRALGHTVEIDPDALASHTRFAGDDATRLAAIHRAAASGADVALISRGGYGIGRLLPHIDYAALARAAAAGTRFVGLSDFTALQCALLARTGAVTWAGPALCADFGCEAEPDDIMLACFDDLLVGQGEGAGWRLPKQPKAAGAIDSIAAGPGVAPASGTFDAAFQVEDAVLWGGNLAMLASLVGTPWLPAIDGGVLFVEDVNEHPYRIERMLTQLLHAGVLQRQRALLLGQFTDFRLTPHDKGFRLRTVVEWLRTQVDCPVLEGLPFGHVPTKVLLPVGARVTLAAEGRDAMVVWGHV